MDPSDARTYLAAEIRERADRQGLSLRALAERAEVSRSFLDRIVAGDGSPTVDWLCAIAEALGCRPRDLLP